MRRVLAVLASIGLGIGTIALAAPAQAQTQNAQCTGNSSEAVSMTYPPGIDPGVLVVNLQYQGLFPSSCTTFEWTSADSSDVSVEWSDDGGGTRTSVAAGNQITLDPQNAKKDLGVFATPSAGDIAFTLTFSGGGFTNEFVVTVAAGGGGGDDSGSSAPASAAPAVVDVTVDQITSEVLRTWASTTTVGSWKQLPESSEITGVNENAGKTFVGAATIPNFPVDIAQRQVDNGWGAYETFNEDGDLTSVFIPAGKWMHINGPTRLYAIWSG